MKISLVVTTIQEPNYIMRTLAEKAKKVGANFFVMGDKKSPKEYVLGGASYYSIEDQDECFGVFSQSIPKNHYARKNLGYLAALDSGCDWVVETDDDNLPFDNFFSPPGELLAARRIRSDAKWINAYSYFAPSAHIWPRGLPLEEIKVEGVVKATESLSESRPLIVQGLADENPDVDAVFRLTRDLPVYFSKDAAPIELAEGNWCPFNSQNTWMRREVITLAYLPSYCSFRMTDIWRSFVAQRCLWAIDGAVHFIAPTVKQERNDHNLLKDFDDEVSGYLNNSLITNALLEAPLVGDVSVDIVRCYEALVAIDVIPAIELDLLKVWVSEVDKRI